MIYFDNAATTKVLPEVSDLVVKYMTDHYGNPSALHRMGLDAERALKNSRGLLAKHLGCQPDQLVFTSGGTEGNNLVIQGLIPLQPHQAQGKPFKPVHIITTQIEHASVLSPLKRLEDLGHAVTYLKPGADGSIEVDALIDQLRPNTVLVTVMAVNNELGTILPIKGIGDALKRANYRGAFHVDATQAIGKLSLKMSKLPIDYLTLSAHKCHGPKGIGLLYKRQNTLLEPLFYGGGQESGLRSGTHNVPAIVGMAKAIAIADTELVKNTDHIMALRASLLKALEPLKDDFMVFSPPSPSPSPSPSSSSCEGEKAVPHILSIGFKGVKSEVLLHSLEQHNICVSSGSACSSHKKESVSHVLSAIEAPGQFRDGVIRISFSKLSTHEEVESLTTALKIIIPNLNRLGTKGGR